MQRHASQKQVERAEAEKSQMRDETQGLHQRLSMIEGSGAATEERCRALEAQLRDKEGEVGQLTMSLQQSILEQKGVAESALSRKGAKGTPVKASPASAKPSPAAAPWSGRDNFP